MSTDHEELRDHYELYALGLLDGPEKGQIDEHLERGCEDCQVFLREAMAIQALMLSQAPDVVPPARLKARIVGSVGEPSHGWAWFATAVAAGMLIVALWYSLESRGRQQELLAARDALSATEAERDRLQQAFVFLEQPETRQVTFGEPEAVPPKGNVYLHPKLGVMLIASNLPVLPDAQIYEMWIVPKEGAPRPAGLFRSDSDEAALHILAEPVDIADVAAIAVTVEPAAGSPLPTSPILIQAQPQA